MSVAYLSTFAESIHQNSCLNFAKALILWNLRVAYVKVVRKGFECENPLTFAGKGLATFAKVLNKPYAADPCV